MLNLSKLNRGIFFPKYISRIKNSRSSIRANSESLVDGALDDKEIAQKFSNAILKNSEKLSYLLEDILNLSTIESGEYNLELSENGVSDIFKNSINSVLSNNPDLKIINNISSDVEVICDVKALSQVIDNLIENLKSNDFQRPGWPGAAGVAKSIDFLLK